MNLIKGKTGSGGFVTEDGVVLPLPAGAASDAITYGVRPEHLTLDEAGFRAEVVVVEPTGAETQVLVRCGGQTLVAVLRERVELNPGDNIGLKPDLSAIHLFGEDGQRL
ncbi:MAG: sugar transporter ATP-binding protein [Proteobacteria bacterium]|nr:sugar transporter ATP-binding protein [Pseudomonadota bacterium]